MESALIQTLVAGTIVAGAALFLGRRAWRTVMNSRRASTDSASCGTDGGCGCATTSTPAEREIASAQKRA
jgi:hypothetical protein